MKILSHVYGSATNNNGVWIEWLDLLTPSFTISHNHNRLQKLTISFQPNPFSLTAEDSPPFISRSTPPLILVYTPYMVSKRTPPKTPSQQFEVVFTAPLCRNGRPIFPRYASSGTWLPFRWPATGLHVTMLLQWIFQNFCVNMWIWFKHTRMRTFCRPFFEHDNEP
jgi:hypothetical protein